MNKEDPVNLSKKVEASSLGVPINTEKWEPSSTEETTTFTMPFGGQVPPMIDVQALKESE